MLTVSDTRQLGDDRSGDTLVDRLTKAGHALADRAIVTDDVEEIRARVRGWIARDDVDAIITTGGTGFTGRDVTPEAIEPLFEKRMEGFSSVFHAISFPKIGTSTIQSRATAGVAGATYIFVLPARPAPARTLGTAFSRSSSITATGRAISWRSCRGSTSTCGAARRSSRAAQSSPMRGT